jgi:HEAT repeat protein
MPLLLQHSLDDRSEVARAAIDALAQLHDPTVSSVLVGLSQKASADRNLRLHAVGALLRMNEPDAPLLLRDYLHSPILPIQIQALEQLIGAGAPAAQLLTLAADPRRAPAFRLRALDAVGRIDSAILVAPILAQRSDPPELRGRAAQLITQIGGPDAQQILAQVAANADDHPGVRVACINGLAQRRDPHAAHVLAQIATGIDEDAIRARAAVALVAVHTN